jgi:T5SS/PEP-CTERM-associated repeat protein
MKLRHVSTAFLVTCLLLLCSQGRAEVIAIGDVDPSGATDPWEVDGELKVGNTGEGTLNIENGGVVSNAEGYIGYDSDSVGTATVTGEGSQWNNSSSLYVGFDGGNGTLNIMDGGVVSNGWGFIGETEDSVGTVTVTGEGSEWNNSGYLEVGYEGEGTLNITDGGVVNATRDTSVARQPNSSGVINFDNGTLNTGGLFSSFSNLQGTGTINTHGFISDVNLTFASPSSLSQSFTLDDPGQNISLNLDVDGTGSIGAGYEGTALLHISGGTLVRSGVGFLGYKAGSNGTAFVVGEGSQWNNSSSLSSSLSVGYLGEGTLNIESGGVVSNTNGYLGNSPGSVGTATVTGEGSEWNNFWSLHVGDWGGEGTLNIEDGGVVSSGDGCLGCHSSSAGTVTVTGDGSEWNSDSLAVGVGDQNEGALNIKAGGVVNVAETTTLNNSTLHIELSDTTSGPSLITDRLNLGGTLELSLADGFVAESGSTFGILDFNTVSGSFAEMNLPVLEGGLEWDTSQLLVDGTILLPGLPKVFTVGDVSPSGATDPWVIDGDLKVGRTGEGTLNIEDGGVVSNGGGVIGHYSGSVGTVTVTGQGSEWNNSGILRVGRFGEGTLNIMDGGVVTIGFYGDSYLGFYSDSVGTATVAGAGSEWNNLETLGVGRFGEGTLNIMDGGVVSNTAGFIGFGTTEGHNYSVGTVTVTGEGSEWNNSGNLTVGDEGEGTLNITDEGTVNVARDTWVATKAGSSGVINFDNGTLNTGGLISSLGNLQGTGTINTHGLVSDVNLTFDSPSSLSQSFTLDDPGQNISLNLEVDGTGAIGAGYEGTALLQISGGIKVDSAYGYLGYKAGSSGTAFVVGEGSEWNNSSYLFVGWVGEGTLNIEGGGVVTNTTGYLGFSSDSVGTATVAGEGSAWNNSRSLNVGRRGEGTLNITDGGVVNVAETTYLNNSTLHIELSDSTSGPSLITDSLEVDGTLEISLADGFVPELGSSFDILDFNTVSGSFAEMNLPILAGNLEWDTSQLLVDGTLYIPLAGDFNNDGTIDAADFTVWQDNLGLSASALNGNGSGAATVVQADYLLWKTNFGLSAATGSKGAAAVPEPTTLLLALLALVAAPLRVRCG